MAGPTGFEPAISSVTGWHVGPLHHGPAGVTVAEHSIGRPGLQEAEPAPQLAPPGAPPRARSRPTRRRASRCADEERQRAGRRRQRARDGAAASADEGGRQDRRQQDAGAGRPSADRRAGPTTTTGAPRRSRTKANARAVSGAADGIGVDGQRWQDGGDPLAADGARPQRCDARSTKATAPTASSRRARAPSRRESATRAQQQDRGDARRRAAATVSAMASTTPGAGSPSRSDASPSGREAAATPGEDPGEQPRAAGVRRARQATGRERTAENKDRRCRAGPAPIAERADVRRRLAAVSGADR